MTSFASLKTRLSTLRNAWPLSPLSIMALTIAFTFIADNSTFWRIGSEIFLGHSISFFAYVCAVFFLMLAFFSFFSFPWLVKPFGVVMLLTSAVTSYYMDTLGVIIDRDMIQNVMVTTLTESKHLITFGFISQIVIYGVLPSLLIAFIKVKRTTMIRSVAMPALSLVMSLAMASGLLMSDMKSYSSILRERKDFMSSFQPGAPVVGAIRYAKMMLGTANVTVAAIGEDAAKGPSYDTTTRPLLTIIVAGETARTQNFSLNGYEVPTNTKLEKLPVVSFANVSSCGTATAVSLPCMFSRFNRSGYSYAKGVSNENVLDVLTRAGLHVEWWDNNTGDKAIADRIPTRSLTHSENAEFCAAGECIDGIFMEQLEDYAQSITQDTVLVLHQIGSHGPTYYLRYPEEFEKFSPACRTAEFKDCTPQEITNAYDNTIAYTDEILAQTIAFLQAQKDMDTALLYVSDHGESLGEGGLYLHGSPYFMAPEYQNKVPMILWMSDAFQNRVGLNKACMAAQKDTALSHDNLFHSLLGMMDIKTSERNPKLDIFATCKDQVKVSSK